jgi:hypothetical protein
VVIERVGAWIGHRVSQGMAWFDGLPDGVQLLVVILVLIAIAALLHLDELKRERDWCEFRRWQRWRRRIAQLVLPRELR